MKLATLKQGGRDGTLVVVNRDLTRAQAVPAIAPTLQTALDHWAVTEPQLREVYAALNNGHARHAIPFDPAGCHSPLPRAYQWADGSAYVNHVELVRKARNADMPASFWTDPLMYQGGSDSFIGPCDAIVAASEDWGIDMEGEVAVITDDVPMGTTADEAAAHIKLLMLANDVSLRNLIPAELAKGFGFLQSKPATAFSPVAVTADELGSAEHRGHVEQGRIPGGLLAARRSHAGAFEGCGAGPRARRVVTRHLERLHQRRERRRERLGSAEIQ